MAGREDEYDAYVFTAAEVKYERLIGHGNANGDISVRWSHTPNTLIQSASDTRDFFALIWSFLTKAYPA